MAARLTCVADGAIARRGCSTKMPMFHVECENHVSGVRNEKFCYCSFQLCNGAGAGRPALSALLLLPPALLLLGRRQQ